MKKYVYNIKNFLTQKELKKLCYDIKYPITSKLDILSSLNIDEEFLNGMDIEDLETTIHVEDIKSDIRPLIQSLNFSLLEFSDHERNRIINYLKINGVNCSSENLEELRRVMTRIQSDKVLLFELNTIDLTIENLQDLFCKYHIATDPVTIQNIVNLVHHMIGSPDVYLPTIRNKYYDENNDVITRVNIVEDKKSNCNLASFEGTLFESISFSNEEEIELFKQKYDLNCDIDLDTTSIMHFKGEGREPLEYCEIYIIKEKLCIYIYYDVPHFLVTQDRCQGIKANELESIRELLIRKTPENEFRKYVLRELKALQKSIQKKEYIRNEEIIDQNSKKAIEKILLSEHYGDTRSVYYRAEIVSSSPIKTKNEKNMQYVLKK